MEFLDGQSLRDEIEQAAAAAAQRVLRSCPVLRVARRGARPGIIHRDIKPDNVFLLEHGGPPRLREGARLLGREAADEADRMKTQAGVVFGTPQYMSPEQGRGVPLDARSDLYALGILAYEMLTGKPPFDAENPMRWS